MTPEISRPQKKTADVRRLCCCVVDSRTFLLKALVVDVFTEKAFSFIAGRGLFLSFVACCNCCS